MVLITANNLFLRTTKNYDYNKNKKVKHFSFESEINVLFFIEAFFFDLSALLSTRPLSKVTQHVCLAFEMIRCVLID